MFIRRMHPAYPFGQLGREVNRLFDSVVGPTQCCQDRDMHGLPAVNVWEDDDNVYTEAEVPGVSMEDMELTVVDNELSIKGIRKPERDEGVTYHRQERGKGEFSRFITLPTAVDADGVDAVLTNGVLTITLPKAADARPRRIEVKSG